MCVASSDLRNISFGIEEKGVNNQEPLVVGQFGSGDGKGGTESKIKGYPRSILLALQRFLRSLLKRGAIPSGTYNLALPDPREISENKTYQYPFAEWNDIRALSPSEIEALRSHGQFSGNLLPIELCKGLRNIYAKDSPLFESREKQRLSGLMNQPISDLHPSCAPSDRGTGVFLHPFSLFFVATKA